MNLLRWVSARTIKETFAPPRDFHYPFMSACLDCAFMTLRPSASERMTP